MTLKANRPRAFRKTFLIYFPLCLIMGGFAGFSEGKSFDPWGLLGLGILGGSVFSLCAAFFQTPGEINWDDEKFSIRFLLPGSREYQWDQLVSYKPLGYRSFGVFVIRFRGKLPYQFLSTGFTEEAWDSFQQFLLQHHPDKQKNTWF